ncbi:MAG TPA: ABC transporter permease, partial [Thermoanaerobaculia bacterium]
HWEREVEKHLRAGRSRQEALRLTRLAFGGVDQVKDSCREARGVEPLATLVRDLAFGLRMMRKNPTFSAIAVLTLAIGIGANTALFSIVDGVLLKPLPFPHPEQLVRIHESKPNFPNGAISYPNFRDWRQMNKTFSGMATTRGSGFQLTGRGEPEALPAVLVSSDYFPLLGVKPLFGRTFAPGEDEIGAPPTVLVSEAFWRRKLGASANSIHESLTLDGKDFAILGIVPASFTPNANGPTHPDLYVPVGQWANPLLRNRNAGLGFHGIGRLKRGVTIEQARADLQRITSNLAATYPADNKGVGAKLRSLKDEVVGDTRPFLLVLFAAVGFVLLIACVNVANLLLARSTGRAGELAVRAALGASQGRLVRQLLTESVLLAAAGGALGVLLAAWGTRAALAVLPARLPRAEEIGMDARVLVFTVVVSLAAGILFGLVPALRVTRTSWYQTLKEGGRGASAGRQRAQDAFVVAEMALAVVLLIGAGLMIRTLGKLWSVDPGFRPEGVATTNVALPSAVINADAETVRASWRSIESHLATVPGLVAWSPSWAAFPIASEDDVQFWLDGQPKPASLNEMSWALRYRVGEAYLKAMQIPLRRGRFFDAHDDSHTTPVAVVDEVFAKQFFGTGDPLHQRIHLNDDDTIAEIVGVVGHVKQWGLDTDDHNTLRAQLYLPFYQMPDKAMVLTARNNMLVLRSATSARGALAAVRDLLMKMSSDNEVYGEQTMSEIIANSLAARRFSMVLLACFALLALGLASIGLYGVTSYLVGQKTQEIGVRIALGARRASVLRLILRRGVATALLGAALGVVAAFGLTRLMGNLLYGVSATDP